MASPETREREAWDARYKHAKAASTWAQVAEERPDMEEECEILARWMGAYADADAKAEREFCALRNRKPEVG